MSTINFKPTVALKTIKKHGLEGKVTPEKLAEVAQQGGHDIKNKGYISGDEFDAAATALKAQLEAPSAGTTSAPTGQTFSPLMARTAVIAPKADLNNPDVALIKTRTLANIGEGKRFGALDAGHGLRAFTVDESMLANINDDKIKTKLKDVGAGQLFGVLTTGDSPELLLGKVVDGEAKVGGSINLRYLSAAKVLGQQDTYKAVADAFGKAPQIELGGEDPSWSLGSSDWASGAKFGAIQAARDAIDNAISDAMAGPTTLAAFQAAGVGTHKHTAAEKKALLKTVKAGAGEDKTFPNPDDSYYGLHTYLMEGPAAAHAVAFAQANRGGPVKYDPSKHSVIVTMKSFDEAQVGTFVVDRKTQEVVFGIERNAVDYDQDAVKAFFPTVGDAHDAFVIGTLARRGEPLGVVAGKDEPDGMNFANWLDDA